MSQIYKTAPDSFIIIDLNNFYRRTFKSYDEKYFVYFYFYGSERFICFGARKEKYGNG